MPIFQAIPKPPIEGDCLVCDTPIPQSDPFTCAECGESFCSGRCLGDHILEVEEKGVLCSEREETP